MKKTVLKTAVLMALGASAQMAYADEITGSYVQGDIGLAYMKADTVNHSSIGNALKTSYKEAKLMPRVSVGYDFGDWRVAGDYTHYSKLEEGNSAGKTSTQVSGVGVSAIYDFNLNTPIPVQPYVGARLSVNRVKQKTELYGVSSTSDSSTKVSPGLLAGVGYKLDNHLMVDTGYRYNHLDSDVQVHEVSVGLRYTF